MIKKIICIILCLLILCGCGSAKKEDKFIEVENIGYILTYPGYLLYDRDTDLMYIGITKGGISPYYNSKGEIMTYTEYCKEK